MDLVLQVIRGRGSTGNHVRGYHIDGRKAHHRQSTLESPSGSMGIRLMRR
jgi:hypothetical protein